MPNKFLIEW